ncbi:MAG: TfoX/Sxy family DNA transformation protein [Dehalococcoidales bacterium]|nr:TfoX/Sxy family DNA transformation protein [Dehalococcoidales bacterium]
MGELSALPNVGKVLEANLLSIGVETPEQLRSIGAEEAFRLIRAKVDSGACLHMLYGIQGAIENIPDKYLSYDTRQKLKTFYNSLNK